MTMMFEKTTIDDLFLEDFDFSQNSFWDDYSGKVSGPTQLVDTLWGCVLDSQLCFLHLRFLPNASVLNRLTFLLPPRPAPLTLPDPAPLTLPDPLLPSPGEP